jgi:hypothetical protein
MVDIKGPNVGSPPPSNLQAMQVTAYHVEKGPVTMYRVDAQTAVARFPDEWSLEPWPDSEKSEAAGVVTIPDDWRDLSFPKRRQIAMKLGASTTVTVAEADKLILAEHDRRVAEAKKTETKNDDEHPRPYRRT